jgi:hypothetical protein
MLINTINARSINFGIDEVVVYRLGSGWGDLNPTFHVGMPRVVHLSKVLKVGSLILTVLVLFVKGSRPAVLAF